MKHAFLRHILCLYWFPTCMVYIFFDHSHYSQYLCVEDLHVHLLLQLKLVYYIVHASNSSPKGKSMVQIKMFTW